MALALLYQAPPVLGVENPELFQSTALLYGGFALLLLGWYWHRPRILPRLALLELATDALAVTVLMHASGGIKSGIGGLLVIFVGAASLTLRGRQALFGAALVTLVLLAEQGINVLERNAPAGEFLATGVLGAIIFLIALAIYPLASRLEESEALTRQQGMDLADLAELNEYIIQNLRESVLVVDPDNRIRLINQSAASHVGVTNREADQNLDRVAPALGRLLATWRESPDPGASPPAFMSADGSTRINAHLAPLGSAPGGPVLIFLEDAELLAQKAQQTKLAALGRLSASIAHEIRNPVGALSHASQLLEESGHLNPDDQRLIAIIQTNTRRVNEIVENVLQLSRRTNSRPELVALAGWTREFAAEFSATLELSPGQLLVLPAEDLAVRMDRSHLRQILWNLVENAVQYGQQAGVIGVEISFGRMPGNRRPWLEVADRGPGVPADLREQLFEPFATGRQGAPGLACSFPGNSANAIERPSFRRPGGGGSVFRVVFADPTRWEQYT